MRNITRLCLLLAVLCRTGGSFSPLVSQIRRPHVKSSRRTLTWSTATDPDGSGQKLVALEALEKLLDRQKADILETERLLKKVKAAESNSEDDNNAEFDDGDDGRNVNLAASILSGFDYGFVSRSEGASFTGLSGGFPVTGLESKGALFENYGPPANIVSLGVQQFGRNWNAIKGEYKDEADIELTPKQQMLQSKLEQLTLNSTAIWERETVDGPVEAPLLIKVPYLVLCWFLDGLFEGRYVFSRFFLLETVARMPYFSYITMLHLYETLGFWRRSSDIKRIHFAEEWNEFHHLLIMESLGGDQSWWVRFLAQHSAIVYFLVLCHLWAFSPTLAYKFSELLESHAVNTYGQFIDENEALLRSLPPSVAAVQYYSFGGSDPFFGEYQTTALATGSELRKPGDNMRSLYDVFDAIRADEGDHVSTMKACLDPNVAVKSPSLEKTVLTGMALVAAVSYFVAVGDLVDVSELTGMVDTGAVVDDGASATSLAESIFAGVAGFTSQFMEDEEERNAAGLTADLLEAGTVGVGLEAMRKTLLSALIALAEFLAALL